MGHGGSGERRLAPHRPGQLRAGRFGPRYDAAAVYAAVIPALLVVLSALGRLGPVIGFGLSYALALFTFRLAASP